MFYAFISIILLLFNLIFIGMYILINNFISYSITLVSLKLFVLILIKLFIFNVLPSTLLI